MPEDKKKSFIMYNEYISNFELLPREERGDLIMLIFRYVNDLELNINEYSQSVIMAFSFIKADIERNSAKYNTTCENRAKAAKKREEARKQQANKEAQLTTKSTIVHKKHNCHNCDDNENENVNENGNVNGSDSDNELHIMSNISSSSKKLAKQVSTPTTEETTTTTTFTPPTVEQINEFCKQEGLIIDSAQSFIDYNQSRDWQVGRGTMKDWKANVRRWCSSKRNSPAPAKETSYNVNEIEARTVEKYKRLNEVKHDNRRN